MRETSRHCLGQRPPPPPTLPPLVIREAPPKPPPVVGTQGTAILLSSHRFELILL